MMAGKIKVFVKDFRVTVSAEEYGLVGFEAAPHYFTAEVSLKSESGEREYRFDFIWPLTEQEDKELDSLVAKVVERVKREFKDGFV